MAIKNINIDKPEDLYDVCIIGSGPAGLTLCAELANTGKRICVLESGDNKKSNFADSLRQVKNLGEVLIKPSSRERVFGGTSTTWTGLSAPLDEIDMVYRTYLSFHSGWPITITDLKPYYERASAYGFPKFEELNDSSLLQKRFSNKVTYSFTNLQSKIFMATVPPWNFKEKLQHIFDIKNIDLYLNSTVVNLNSKRTMSGQVEVISAEIFSKSGLKQQILSKIFVLATGGIESSRLLLMSRNTNPSGLGNEHDQVGRYIMNHPKNNFGILKLKKPIRNLAYFYSSLNGNLEGYFGLRVRDDFQRSKGILNSYIRLEPIFPSFRNFKFSSFLTNFLDILFYFFNRLIGRDSTTKTIEIRNFMEMEPKPENRITLSNELDLCGLPIPEVKLNTSPLDRQSLSTLHKVFAEEIKRTGIGLLEGDLEKENSWPITIDASHHLGGTRMGSDPMTSVVNSDLRVHSVNNLYVSSGSVFPTSGCANPTYTICALSVRLADKLKTIL